MNSTCFWCDDTGKFEKPLQEEKYDIAFDRYDHTGVFNHAECRRKALDDVGSEFVPCSHCDKGRALQAYIDYRNNAKGLIEDIDKLLETLNHSALPDASEKLKEASTWKKEFEKVVTNTDAVLLNTFKYVIE